MPAPRCTLCDNSGQVLEVRLVWTKRRQGMAPLRCSRRVESEAEGWEMAKTLGDDVVGVDVLSCSSVCRCRSGAKAEAEPAEAPKDWKMAQAGDE